MDKYRHSIMQHAKPSSRNKRKSSDTQSSMLPSHGVESRMSVRRNNPGEGHGNISNLKSHSVIQIHRSTSASKKWSKLKVMSKVVVQKSKSNLSVKPSNSSRFAYSFSKEDDYNPIEDARRAREMSKQNKEISFCTLLRYATWFDIILMVVGAFVALFCGIIVPWIFYWCGELYLLLILDVKCHDIHHKQVDTTIFREEENKHINLLHRGGQVFLMNTGLGAFLLFLGYYISWRCFAWSADLQMKRIAKSYFEWMVRKDLAWFDIYMDREEFSNVVNEELSQIRSGIGEKFPALISQISTELSVVVLTYIVNYKVALFLFAMWPLFYIGALCSTYAETNQQSESATAFVKAGKMAEDVLCNIKMVKSCQGEEVEVTRFRKYLNYTNKKQLKWLLVSALCSGLIWFGVFLEITGAMLISSVDEVVFENSNLTGYCAEARFRLESNYEAILKRVHFIEYEHLLANGPQSFAVILMAVTFISSHSMDIPLHLKEIMEAKRRASEIFFLIDWKPRIDNLSKEGKNPKGHMIGRLEFFNVGFKYPRHATEWVLRNTSMLIYPTQVIGVFGREKSGKSTVLKLIMRLYDTCEGQITLDGYDIRSYNITWLRTQISLITHETIVFPVSIKENLLLKRSEATMHEIYEACKTAEIHHRILQLPKGYDTVLCGGSHCIFLNQEELRKIAIARALLMKPKILLIDDQVISTDEKFEGLVMKLMQQLRYSSTIIIACARANSLMKHCDHIYYFENGKVAEEGTHLEMLQDKKNYYRMIEDTLDTFFEKTRVESSQLSNYKLAKSLRFRQEKTRRAREALHRDSMIDMSYHLDEYQRKMFYYTGFGYGGFQKYNFAKSPAFHPGKIFKVFGQLKARHVKNKGLKMKKKLKSAESESSIKFKKSRHSSLGLQEETEGGTKSPRTSTSRMSIRPTASPRMSLKIEDEAAYMRNSRELLTPESFSTAGSEEYGGDLSVTNSELENDDDGVSMAPDEAEDFWDDYCDKLDAVKHLHTEQGSWMEILRLSLRKESIGWLALGSFASIALGSAVTINGILIGFTCFAFTEHEDEKRSNAFKWLGIEFVGLGLLSGFAAFTQELCFSLAGKQISTKLRTLMFSSMLRKDFGWFGKNENDISFLCSRLASDPDTVQHVLVTMLGVTVQNMATVIFAICYSLIYFSTPYLQNILLVMSFAVILMIICSYSSGILTHNHVEMMESRLENSSEMSYHTITSMKTCIMLSLEEYFIVQFNLVIDKTFRFFYLLSEMRCIFNALTNSVYWVMLGMLVHFSFYYSPSGKHPFEINVQYIFIIMQILLFRLRNIGNTLSLITKPKLGKIAAHRINYILSKQTRLKHNPKTSPKEFTNPPAIKLVNLYFGFKFRAILKGINLNIEPCSCIAILGEKGSGKTTLSNIIMRLLQHSAGKLLVDGIDIEEDMELSSFRNIIASIERDPAIIHDMTISENITFGSSRKISEKEIVAATTLAQLHITITSLKHGYNTKMDHHHGELNSTDKRRLAIARALVRKPKILVIDDMGDSSDYDSAIQDVLDEIRTRCTVIMLSRKVESLREADIIYVLNDGFIVESGVHSTLLDNQGLYYQMYMTQRMLDAAAKLRMSKRLSANDSEIISRLKRQALSQAKRKSNFTAYTKFLSMEMEKMQEHLKRKDEAMDEEKEEAKLAKRYNKDDEDEDPKNKTTK